MWSLRSRFLDNFEVPSHQPTVIGRLSGDLLFFTTTANSLRALFSPTDTGHVESPMLAGDRWRDPEHLGRTHDQLIALVVISGHQLPLNTPKREAPE